ncbi:MULTISPECIES: hypothetical protein [Paenibacillus]|uniref:hypothetical protein n=1 Tax=Paenibacillus TaxID=44249 RepID=UPI0022B87197|nr:hypothetical protein [Paenibacillus caseinilyticus]MCZ8523691.1 hypothetical protein [Paenibacillus caseinilyticus]
MVVAKAMKVVLDVKVMEDLGVAEMMKIVKALEALDIVKVVDAVEVEEMIVPIQREGAVPSAMAAMAAAERPQTDESVQPASPQGTKATKRRKLVPKMGEGRTAGLPPKRQAAPSILSIKIIQDLQSFKDRMWEELQRMPQWSPGGNTEIRADQENVMILTPPAREESSGKLQGILSGQGTLQQGNVREDKKQLLSQAGRSRPDTRGGQTRHGGSQVEDLRGASKRSRALLTAAQSLDALRAPPLAAAPT